VKPRKTHHLHPVEMGFAMLNPSYALILEFYRGGEA